MDNQGKKCSLFKQKIKLIKQQKQQQNVGFPAAVKIVDIEQGSTLEKKDDKDNQENLNCSIKPKGSIISSINKEGVVSSEEMRKIEGQNWKKVESMSEQERQQMLKMINSQLPQNFLSRLRLGVTTQPQKQIKSEQFIDPPKKQQNEDEEQKWWQSINLNIETQRLQFKQEPNDNLVNISSLSLMIGSENNQSQIVASKLISKFIGKLCELTTDKSRQLIVVDNIPIHLGIILQKASYNLLQIVVRKAKSTNFRSVFIELITRLCESITHANRYLSKQSRLRLSQNMKSLRQKTSQFDMKQGQSKQIKDSLAAVEVLLFKNDNNLNDTNWQTLLNSMEFIIELSLLEEIQSNYYNKYSLKVYNSLKVSSDYDQISGIINFLFELSNRLILKKNKELYVNIIMMRDRWQGAIELAIEKMQSRITLVQIQLAFKIIALARFVGGQTWYGLQNQMKPFLEDFHHLWQFLLFNTLSDMKGSQIHEDDIYSINHLISWLFTEYHTTGKVKCINPNYILNTLMELFLNQDEFYSQLDQKILDSLLCALASLSQIQFNAVLNEEKIRTLIKNYSYNSFGNEVFTRLMLVIAIKSQPNLEGLLLRQVMLPYPDIFYKIGEGCGSECIVDSSKKGSNSDLKEEIKSKIGINSQSICNNKFMIYLSY